MLSLSCVFAYDMVLVLVFEVEAAKWDEMELSLAEAEESVFLNMTIENIVKRFANNRLYSPMKYLRRN